LALSQFRTKPTIEKAIRKNEASFFAVARLPQSLIEVSAVARTAASKFPLCNGKGM
jgi:hypothetical protein